MNKSKIKLCAFADEADPMLDGQIEAMKAKEKERLTVIRMVKAAIKQEVIDNKLFGLTNDNKWLEALLGDYFLIAIGTYSFENFKFNPMIATHAGGTKEENLINLYVINK